jgi:MoxR-like ATPase
MADEELKYKKIFCYRRCQEEGQEAHAKQLGDRSEGLVYVFDPPMELAINVALAAGRPLLVRGPSGSGKSALARAVADEARWSFVEKIVTSRTLARDFLYEIDLLRRLEAARAGSLSRNDKPYLVPGPLFWAFAPELARSILIETGRDGPVPPGLRQGAHRCVVLLDEIDKADPDTPNDLLRPLGSMSFRVDELNLDVIASSTAPPLVIITTNEERDLPPAFLRRCVELTLDHPRIDRLKTIGRRHHPEASEVLIDEIADLVAATSSSSASQPSVAEYLDALRAAQALEPDSKGLKMLGTAVLWKHGRVNRANGREASA